MTKEITLTEVKEKSSHFSDILCHIRKFSDEVKILDLDQSHELERISRRLSYFADSIKWVVESVDFITHLNNTLSDKDIKIIYSMMNDIDIELQNNDEITELLEQSEKFMQKKSAQKTADKIIAAIKSV